MVRRGKALANRQENKALFEHLKEHYANTPNRPPLYDVLYHKYGSEQKYTRFNQSLLSPLAIEAKLQVNKERAAKGQPPLDYTPTGHELYTSKGRKKFVYNPRQNTKYTRNFLEAMLEARLIDSPNQRIETMPAARYLGINPTDSRYQEKVRQLHIDIDRLATKIAKEKGIKSKRPKGGPRWGKRKPKM